MRNIPQIFRRRLQSVQKVVSYIHIALSPLLLPAMSSRFTSDITYNADFNPSYHTHAYNLLLVISITGPVWNPLSNYQ